MSHALRLTCFMLLFWALPALAQTPQAPAWVAALRDGGYVIVLRHGSTYADQVDAKPFDPSDKVPQRQLNDAGREVATSMGSALRALRIPVANVQTSQFQRAVDTGTLLGFGAVRVTEALNEASKGMRMEMAPKEDDRAGAALRTLAATPPAAGTNVILVTHKPNIVGAFGKDWLNVREGEASIFRPDGKGGFTLVTRMQAMDWAYLEQAAAR